MAEETPAPTGASTSEFKLTAVLVVIGGVLEAVATVLHSIQSAGSAAPWIPAVLVVVGALLQLFSSLGYVKSRTLVKTTQAVTSSPPRP